MIALPPGFDVSLFISDLYTFVVPFVGISTLFVAYRLVIKVLRG
jgi:hypothetical protein